MKTGFRNGLLWSLPPPLAPGKLFSWGYNRRGEMGIGVAGEHGSPYYNFSSPVQVGALTTWTTIVCSGYNQVFGKTTDGKLFAWGRNTPCGQLGLGDDVNTHSSPTQIGSLTTWGRISGGSNSGSAGILLPVSSSRTGKAYNWGQIFNPTPLYVSVPVQMGARTDWQDWQTQEQFFLGVIGGKLYGMGNNDHYQLGLGYKSGIVNTDPCGSSPIQVGSNTNWWRTIDRNFTGSLALTTDQRLWAWGFCTHGECGTGAPPGEISRPVLVSANQTWQTVVGGRYFIFGIDTSGHLWSWGANYSGQLGLGDTTQRTSPVQVGTDKWISISGGRYQAVGIKANGTLWGWGASAYGATGHPTNLSYSSPVQIGSDSTWLRCACCQYTSLAIRT